MSACIGEELPATTDLEECLRCGVHLAKLALFFAPECGRKIFDADMQRFHSNGLHFKHTDNINCFLQAAKNIGLPDVRATMPAEAITLSLPY